MLNTGVSALLTSLRLSSLLLTRRGGAK